MSRVVPLPPSHYRLLVSRGWERPQAQLYPFNLNEPIPEIPIPLRAGETEPTLNLGQALAKVYDEVRYDLRIDYTAEPEPPLDPALARGLTSYCNEPAYVNNAGSGMPVSGRRWRRRPTCWSVLIRGSPAR